jgi:type IV pilus assembly protein PilQ
VVLAGGFTTASGREAGTTTGGRLKTITSRMNGKGASLVIEATEPVAYVATRPDPLTVIVDLRNVDAAGITSAVAAASRKGPIADVAVESDEASPAAASRIRITLAQPVAHRVRSDRNTIVIDFDKASDNAARSLVSTASGLAPDAMAALARPAYDATPMIDPIAALGLDALSTAARDTRPSPMMAAAAMRPFAAAQTPAAQSAPPTPPAALEQFTAQPGARKFQGNPVSLDFQGADLRAVLRTFAEISGLNIVIDPAVQGTVDVSLRDVPWDQALDIILRANKLGYLIDGTIVRIAPLSVMADEETQRRKLTEEQALAGQLTVITKTLSYAKAEEMQALLTKSALSPRGSVQVDPRTNTLIISDLADRLTTAIELITTLDRAQPQVEIEARIVQTTKNYARALGIQWGFGAKVSPALGNTTNLAFPNNGSLTGTAGGASGATPPSGTAVNFPAAGALSGVGLALGSINGAFNLDVALSALENSGNARLLSTPRVSTQNNIEAEIAQGVQVPYQTSANNTVTTQFKDAALILKVMPQITAANTVILKITVDNGSVGPSFGGVPSINTQRATTTVQVSDGQTTVLGGIYASNETASSDRTPGLSRVPFLKWLFKRDSMSDGSTELLIFITPRIIKS